MKFVFMVCLLFAAALANSQKNSHGPNFNGGDERGSQTWKENTVYQYKVSMRTMTSLGDQNGEASAENWAGMEIKSRLTIHVKPEGRLAGRLSDTSYRHVHSELSGGPLGELPKGDKSQWHQYSKINRPFEVQMRNGLVQELWVSKDMKMQEENLLKGLLGSLQYDTSRRNLKNKANSFFDEQNSSGVFKKMEREVTGDCEVLYSISPLSMDNLEQHPELAPFVQLEKLLQQNKHQNLVNIAKTKNYAKCDKRVSYNFGVSEGGDSENSAHSPNNFMRRSTNYRIIADRENGTIYSTSGVDKIFSNPMMYSKDLGMVVSSTNIKLESVEHGADQSKESSSLRSAGSLIYSMGSKKHNKQSNSESSIDEQSNQRHEQKNQQGGERGRQGDYDNDDSLEQGTQGGRSGRSRRSVLPENIPRDQSEDSRENANKIDKRQHDRKGLEYSQKFDSNSNESEESQGSKSRSNFGSQGYHQSSRSDSGSGSNSASDSGSSSTYSHDSWIGESDVESGPLPLINSEEFKMNTKKNPVDVSVEIVIEIASEMQDPNKMPHTDTLSKINHLVNWVATMNAKELQEASKKLKSTVAGKEIKDAAQRMFLDAVTQSGTKASYTHIKNLIMSKELQGETASQVVSVMAISLRYPTQTLVTDFFRLAFTHLVRQQSGFNSTILMSVSGLINRAFVNRKTMHNYYPSHYTGRPSTESSKYVVGLALTTLDMELKKAIKQRDDHKAQVFIAAIGNLGHPSILEVFKPYLEQKVRTTKFLRQHMVLSLGQLAQVNGEQSKYTLFNIFKNEGDDYEVRVAAILELVKAHPSATMLQQMAQQSHTDSSTQVRAAIKTVITYAAGLDEREEKFRKLARNAKAAKEMLTEEEFGYQLSGKYIDYYFLEEYNVGRFFGLGLIGSDDSILHKHFSFTSWEKRGEWMKPNKVQASISSIGQLIELIQNKLKEGSQQGSASGQTSSSKFSAEKIASIFNIKSDSREALQANLLVKLMNQERFFAVGQDTFENLPRDLHAASERLRQGQSLNYTKFYNRDTVEIFVPTITGMMYYHKFKNPVYIQLNGRVQAKINSKPNKQFGMPETVNATGKVHFVLASDFDGKVGFYCPFGDKFMSAGVISKFQVNIPVRINTDIDFVNGGVKVELSSLHGKQDVEILHRSQKKYTSIRGGESTVVPSQDKDTKFIQNAQPRYSNQYTLGQQSIGMAFSVESEDDRRSDQSAFGWSPKHLIDNVYYFWVQKSYRRQYLSVKYNPSQSQNNKIVVNLNYDNNYEHRQQQQQQSPAWGSAAQVAQSIPSDLTPGSKNRQQQLLHKVASGITNARASLLDIGVQFSGQKKAEFSATIATASSPVDEKVQAIFFFGKTSPNGKQFQINAAVAGKMPNAPMLDFQKALEFKTHADFDIQVNYGAQPKSDSQIGIKVNMEQTEQRREYIRQTKNGIACKKQMSQGNYLMRECENATHNANTVDAMKMSVTYQNIDEETRSLAYSIYSAVKYYASSRIEADWYKNGQANKLEVEARLSPDLEVLNVGVVTPHAHILLKNLPVSGSVAKAAFGMNPFIPSYIVLDRNTFDGQLTPSCALDKSLINTFSDRTYEYSIGDCWHVAVQSDSLKQQHGFTSHMQTQQQTTVLVRQIQGQKEVRIHYRSYRGDEIEVDMKPDGSISVNGKAHPIPAGKIVEVWTKDGESRLLSAYHMTQKELNVVIHQGALQILSNGQQVVLVGSEELRNRTRGLCGRMGNDRQHDLATPDNCFMKDDRYFGPTWAMHQDPQCDQQVKQLSQEAKRKTCIHRYEQSPSIQTGHQDSVSGAKNTKSYSGSDSCGLQKMTQVYEERGQICITLEELEACNGNCREQQKYQRKVGVVCRSEKNSEFREMRKSIEAGENVQLDQNKFQPNAHAIFMVPKKC